MIFGVSDIWSSKILIFDSQSVRGNCVERRAE